ncbi:MAG: hypothetical protein ABW352_00100 [Polyangiales bacterium]
MSLALLAAAGCGRAPESHVSTEPAELRGQTSEYGSNGELLNEGTLCLFQGEPEDRDSVLRAPGDPLELVDGGDLHVAIRPIPATGCTRTSTHSCVVEQQSDGLRVTSSSTTSAPDGPCIAEGESSGTLAVCRIPKLAPGHHMLHWGTHSLRFELPGSVERATRCVMRVPRPASR